MSVALLWHIIANSWQYMFAVKYPKLKVRTEFPNVRVVYCKSGLCITDAPSGKWSHIVVHRYCVAKSQNCIARRAKGILYCDMLSIVWLHSKSTIIGKELCNHSIKWWKYAKKDTGNCFSAQFIGYCDSFLYTACDVHCPHLRLR